MARKQQIMDRSPEVAEEQPELEEGQSRAAVDPNEKPYAQYTVSFFNNRIEASIPVGIEKLSVGKMQRSLRFLFREFGQKRRRMYGHVTRDNAARIEAFNQETLEKEQTHVR